MNHSLTLCVFSVILITAIVEGILSFTWSKLYYSKGICVMTTEVSTSRTISDIFQILEDNIIHEKAFDRMRIHKINDNLIGFKETMINTSLFAIKYPCILHGSIYSQENKTYIKLYINWFLTMLIFDFLLFLLIAFHPVNMDSVIFTLIGIAFASIFVGIP